MRETMRLQKLEKTDSSAIEDKLRAKLEKEIRKELEKEYKASSKARIQWKIIKQNRNPKLQRLSRRKKDNHKQSKVISKEVSRWLVWKENTQEKYEGEPGGKADWFLENALDTVYDPHGTGKILKPATILARSTDGNVRVRDVVRIYDVEGEDGISDLAWTSPQTKYLIEAYDAC